VEALTPMENIGPVTAHPALCHHNRHSARMLLLAGCADDRYIVTRCGLRVLHTVCTPLIRKVAEHVSGLMVVSKGHQHRGSR
jgi:hypothetical protein